MQYFSQTGSGIHDTKEQSTAPGNIGFISIIGGSEVIFQETKSNFSSKDQILITDGEMKEELTQEEENKFYRKVLKTSLI